MQKVLGLALSLLLFLSGAAAAAVNVKSAPYNAVGNGSADDTVAILGCGGVGLGAIAASNARRARTICVDMDDEKLVVARAAEVQLLG